MNFDPNKPYNELPYLPPKYDFDDIDILKKVNIANIALSKLSGEAKTIPNRIVLIEPLTFREAVASSEIENIHTTVEEAFESIYKDEIDLNTEQKETKNYKEALLKGYDIIEKNDFLVTNSYIEIQSILEPNRQGIRRISGTKIVNQNNGEVIFTPPEGENIIRDLLKNFEDYFNEFDENVDVLIKMAVLHYQFECIHPFLDGNGRTGRILMILYLCLAKRLELPILFLSGYINKNKNEYYKLLKEVTSLQNWKEWIFYVLEAVEVQSKATTNTVIGIRELMNKYKNYIHEKRPKLKYVELVEYLFSYPYYSKKTLQSKMGITRNTATKYFSDLREIGIIKELMYKNDKIYYCPEFHSLLK